MEVCRGESNFSQSSGVRRKDKSSTEGEGGGGVQLLNAVAHSAGRESHDVLTFLTTRLLISWFLVKYHSEMKCFFDQ